MRDIGLDVHRDFCEVAIAEGGELRSAGRIEATPKALELFAHSLGSDDRGCARGDGQRVGDRPDHRAARRESARRQSERHRDQASAREDRPARRAHARKAACRGLAGGPLDARCPNPGPAPPPSAALAAGAGAHPGEERGPRGADSPPGPQAPGQRPVRSGGQALARGPRRRSARRSTARCARSTSSSASSQRATA